jgi:glycosyltransferase involved in cell wall biosynthesis
MERDDSVLFSIVMPTYNRANLIGKAIRSVLGQEYSNWELLIIDDGSTDDTEKIVGQFNDARIQYVFQKNQERSAARNNGVRQANGDYICFLDSDDYYLPNFLNVFEQSIQKNKLKEAFYFCNTFCENSNGELTKSVGANVSFSDSYDFLLINTIGTPRVCLPARIAKNYPFDLSIKNGEDFELWLRLIGDLDIKYINEYTQVFIDHENRSINDNVIDQVENAIQLREEVALKYIDKFSEKAYIYFKNQNNIKFARTYLGVRRLKCIKYSIRIILSSSSSKKEAVYMLLKSISPLVFQKAL